MHLILRCYFIDSMSKRIGIICGGFSSEFEISVKSAKNILNNLPDDFEKDLIYLRRSGWTVIHGEDELPFDPQNFNYVVDGKTIQVDLAIVYIHGDPGENGKVQAFLELIDIPYINSGPLASQLSFDKWFCNQFLKGFDVPVAQSIYLANENVSFEVDQIINQLGLPVFVKPCDSGSSYGIARVNRKEDLEEAIKIAFKEGRSVVIEEFLDGTEVTCGVYRGGEGINPLPLTEIVSKNEFFDFAAKYQGLSDEITPARISDELTTVVQELAKKVYGILQLRSIARIDFMLVNNTAYLIEVNTTPGFSNASIVPKMISVSGKSTKEVWQEIIQAELGH